jgi:hypothetical protein
MRSLLIILGVLNLFLIYQLTEDKIDGGIVHDYIWERGKVYCSNNEGMHYITNKVLYTNLREEKAKIWYKVSCQNGAKFFLRSSKNSIYRSISNLQIYEDEFDMASDMWEEL